MRRDRDRDGGVDPRELLDRERVRDGVAAGTAVLLGDRQPHQAQLAEVGDDLVRKTRLAVELLCDRRDLLARELAHRVADELLLLGEVEVHAPRNATRVDSALQPIKERTEMAENVQEFFNGLAARADAEKTAGMNNSYLFDIEGAGEWVVKVEDGKVEVTEGGGEADTTITTSEETMMAVSTASRTPRPPT